MSLPDTNRPMFNQSSDTILQRGLHTMTLACDALTAQNKTLNEKVETLESINSKLKEQLLTE